MSKFQITSVRTESSASGLHEHITEVGLGSSGVTLLRSTVISDLRDPNGDRYYTYGGGEYADVVVRGCPYCAYSDYITTTPDSTTENNLLSLPRF